MRLKRLCLLVLCLLASLSIRVQGAQCMQQAFLVQNSGWMEPFFADPSSPFKNLVASTIDNVCRPDDAVSVLAFNQSAPGHESPQLLFQGAPSPEIRKALASLGLARKKDGGGLADTDFKEAVLKTITSVFKGQQGILWIFTNNKNSPNNNKNTAKMNRDFYAVVHSQEAIVRTLALPLSMPLTGKLYKANGLMVYVMAYGAKADAHLQALVDSGRLAKVITQAPAQLKPLDRDAIRIVPRKVLDAPDISASLAKDGRTLLVDVDVSSRRPVVQLVAGLENLFYPYSIKSASVSAKAAAVKGEMPLSVAPSAIEGLAPGKSMETLISLPINVTKPSPWSLSGLLQFGRSIRVPAVLLVQLDDQHLELDEGFRERMGEIFPGDPLPDVFTPPASVKTSVARINMVVRVNYPLTPLVVAMAGLLLLLGGGIFLASMRGSAQGYTLEVDGAPRRVSVGRFSSIDIHSDSGEKIAVLSRGFGEPTLKTHGQGHSIFLRR